MVLFSASIMCANQLELKKELVNLEGAGIDMLHCDVMDGIFVNNLAMGPYVLEQIKENSNIPLDIHLATIDPEKYIRLFLPLKPKYISFHIETTNYPFELITLLKENNIGASIAISPETDISKIETILKYIDMVLIMTVNPGFAGQNFNYKTLSKLAELKRICQRLNVNPTLEVDGCINASTIPLVVNAGANLLVLGTSSLFKNNHDYKQKLEVLKKLINNLGEN